MIVISECAESPHLHPLFFNLLLARFANVGWGVERNPRPMMKTPSPKPNQAGIPSDEENVKGAY